MLTEFLDLKAWGEWLASLDREFFFLLALPFVVAVIGLWSWWVDKEDIDREYEARAAQAEQRERQEAERGRSTQLPHHGLR